MKSATAVLKRGSWIAWLLLGMSAMAVIGTAGDYAVAWFYRLFPVVTTDVQVLTATPDEVVLRIKGEKHWNCAYWQAMLAEGTTATGTVVPLEVDRIDKPETGITRNVGPIPPGVWKVYPRNGAIAVRMYATHLCGSRVVASKYADVKVP